MKYKLYFDGSITVNPGGKAAAGWVLKDGNTIIAADTIFVGEGEDMTVNLAEYHGLVGALEYVVLNEYDNIEILGDSKLVINMVSGSWGKKNPHKKFPKLLELLIIAKNLYKMIPNASIKWIPRDDNYADQFSRI